jgi:hypothetical protein
VDIHSSGSGVASAPVPATVAGHGATEPGLNATLAAVGLSAPHHQGVLVPEPRPL